MSKRDHALEFAAMANPRYQMSVPKEQVPALVAELITREKNIEVLNLIESYLKCQTISGNEILEVAQCLHWVAGVRSGESVRVKEVKASLPKEDTEIKLGPEEPAAPEVAVGGVEIQAGEPVFAGTKA